MHGKSINSIYYFVFLQSVFLVPVSYGIKYMFNLDTNWIDPSLIIGAILFIALIFINGEFLRIKNKTLLILIVSFQIIYLISAFLNSIIRSNYNLGDVIREPLKLILLIFFAYLVYFFSRDMSRRIKIYNIIGISSVIHLITAIYLSYSIKFNFPIPSFLETYTIDFVNRQSLWLSTPIPRLAGTFFESPPFGLFMLVVFYTTIMAIYETKSVKYVIYLIVSILGMIGTFSTQVLIAFTISSLIIILFFSKKTKYFRMFVLLFAGILFVFMSYFSINEIITKINLANSDGIYGTSVGERSFHFKNGLSLFGDNLKNILIGVGPGEYGYFASKTGIFPSTVTTQFTIIEVLVETGVLGLLIFIFLVCLVGVKIGRLHGVIGVTMFVSLFIANSFQASWKWTSFFLFIGLLLSFRTKVRD